ncbi:MAG TPA: DUF4872 domain-containing protein [Candidatus Limnocylindrales bacterium]|nr:DUF4872 domain-containing protein [Candidatus Limnocylindrales bacterium]
MTNQKHLKGRVRERMAKTGERYAAARANVVAGRQASTSGPSAAPSHLPGIHPETAAMRIVAGAAGVRDPKTGGPPSEELVFLVAGGIGIAVFAFRYPEFSSLFLSGRHRLDDSRGFVVGGLERLGLSVEVAETGGAAAAGRHLARALEAGPAIAWCDLVELGTRGVPAVMSGAGYHAVAVLAFDEAAGTVTIGDLRRAPEVVDADRFARARARIARDRNRLAWVTGRSAVDWDTAIGEGLAATISGFRNPRSGSFGIASLERLADRMTARSGRDAWPAVFPRGGRLWYALRSIYEFVETYRSGGGLMRPMFARGLTEAAGLTGNRRLEASAARYVELGARWTDLASAALPAEVALLDATRQALDSLADRHAAGAGPDELAAIHRRIDGLADAAAADFPLDEAATNELLAGLSGRLREIAALETAALDELERLVGA